MFLSSHLFNRILKCWCQKGRLKIIYQRAGVQPLKVCPYSLSILCWKLNVFSKKLHLSSLYLSIIEYNLLYETVCLQKKIASYGMFVMTSKSIGSDIMEQTTVWQPGARSSGCLQGDGKDVFTKNISFFPFIFLFLTWLWYTWIISFRRCTWRLSTAGYTLLNANIKAA